MQTQDSFGATNLEDKIRRISMQEHEYNDRLMNYGAPRAALVKLSDRLHNMRTIQGHRSLAKQKRIAYEAWLFLVPLAMKLALAGMAQALKKLSLEVWGKEYHKKK